MLRFSICACHPCAGGHANLLWIVPILSDDPRGGIHWAVSKKGAYPAPSRHHQCHGWPFTIDIPLLAFFRPGLCPNVLHSAAVSSWQQHATHAHAPGAKARLAAASHRLSWAEARVKIARMTSTIKLDGNWSSFQLANSAPPLSVTDSAIAPSARMFFQQLLT